MVEQTQQVREDERGDGATTAGRIASRRRSFASAAARGRAGTIALVALLALTGWTGGAARTPLVAALSAQEETPAAACEVPEAEPATPAAEATAPPATPGLIVPIRRGVATPVPDGPQPAPAATPDAQAALTAELTAVAEALAACLSTGEAEIVATLATTRYLGQLYGGGLPLSRDDYLALAPDLNPVSTVIRSVGDVRSQGDGFASAEVVSVVGRQLLRSRWAFVLAPQTEREADRTPWRVDAEEPLPVDAPPADRLEVAIADYTFGLDESEVAGPTVVLAGSNAGAEDHEILVLRFGQGLTPADLLRQPGPGLPDGITYVGQATVPIAATAELVLVDLEPGDYTIVCLFPTPRGTPHLALGMVATFTVT